MEYEVSERLAVDSLMTADGEVVQLPTLGSLGPVDAEGGRIPLDTVKLFDAEGRFLKVESYEFSTWSQRWVVHLGSDRDAYADDCYLCRPDSFVNTLFTDEWYSDAAMKKRGVVQIPLCYLAKSLENMSLCHAAYFCKGWEDARGCRIEHDAAVAYGLEVLYED